MVKTAASILLTFALIFGLSWIETRYVENVFSQFHMRLTAVQEKAEDGTVTQEDGVGIRDYWNEKRRYLHSWLPHTALQEIDYRVDEMVGFIYVADYKNAVTGLEVLIGLTENIPHSYSLRFENVF
ncbi:MAG: DUF4363 family protein [Clostridia bacterium]|nr:DUF4363 family protein [Clostridia bacterium]